MTLFFKKLKAFFMFLGTYLAHIIICYNIMGIAFAMFLLSSIIMRDDMVVFIPRLILGVCGIFLQEIIYVKLNAYVIVNRFSGKISMSFNRKFLKLKKKVGHNSLDFLAQRFSEGILKIPDAKGLKRFDSFFTDTHERMFKKILQYYPVENLSFKVIKTGAVKEKVLVIGNPFKIFKTKYYRFLTEESNKYLITIDRAVIESYKNKMSEVK